MIGVDYFGKHAIEQLKFTRNLVDPIRVLGAVMILKLERMVANLSKSHHSIRQALIANLPCDWISCNLAFQDAIVNYLLPVRKLDFNDHFSLWRQLLLDFLLHTP